MGNRGVLRGQLVSAWHTAIKTAYENRLINNERGLQVHLCTALLPLLNKHHLPRSLFVEPHIRIGSHACMPDLIICDSRQVIGIVEMKYSPRIGATKWLYSKDVKTLLALSIPEEEIVIDNRRYLGSDKGHKPYTIAKDAILCWAGVYKGEKEVDVFAGIDSIERKRLLVLHALTKAGTSPTVLPDG